MNKQVTLLLTDTIPHIGMLVTEDEAARSKSEWLDADSPFVTLTNTDGESLQIAVDYVVGFVIADEPKKQDALQQIPENVRQQLQAG